MGCAHNKNQNGFTLVEISIVMIIIGLLIGGTFGGMKLIENMQINRTVQDLKAIESAALTFRDSYGRLPGDLVNAATRLPSCTVAPCATSGNGDRRLDAALGHSDAITATNERFTFWHHLQAASLLAMDYRNTTAMDFGDGQPSAPIGGGYRVSNVTGPFGCSQFSTSFLNITDLAFANMFGTNNIACSTMDSIDRKMDDGLPAYGKIMGLWCVASAVCEPPEPYSTNNTFGRLVYDTKF